MWYFHALVFLEEAGPLSSNVQELHFLKCKDLDSRTKLHSFIGDGTHYGHLCCASAQGRGLGGLAMNLSSASC